MTVLLIGFSSHDIHFLLSVHVKLQGFNSTLTEVVESSGRRGGDQIKEMELKLHLDLKDPLTTLCNDPKTTVVVLSGSDRSVLDDVRLYHKILFKLYQIFSLLKIFNCRILGSTKCGWQQKMECFCVLQMESG